MLGCHDSIPLLEIKGLIPEERIQKLIATVVSRGGMVKDLHGHTSMLMAAALSRFFITELRVAVEVAPPSRQLRLKIGGCLTAGIVADHLTRLGLEVRTGVGEDDRKMLMARALQLLCQEKHRSGTSIFLRKK